MVGGRVSRHENGNMGLPLPKPSAVKHRAPVMSRRRDRRLDSIRGLRAVVAR